MHNAEDVPVHNHVCANSMYVCESCILSIHRVDCSAHDTCM